MDSNVAPPAESAYQDRHAGLIVFGILGILLGLACLLLAPLAYFGQMMAAARTGTELNRGNALLGVMIYGLLGTVMIWLSIGSILARRWARALILCGGWIGLIIGLVAMPVVWVALGSVGPAAAAQGHALPPAALVLVRWITLGVTFVIYIVIPGLTVLFYRGRNVRLTCEARDPVARWTDRCPLPVLALCLLKAFSAGFLLLFLFTTYGHIFPLFGSIVQGVPARILWVALVAFLLYAARGFYRLDRRVYWTYLAGALLLWSSSFVTFLRVDMVDYYRLAGMPERQLAHIAQNPLMAHNTLALVNVATMVVGLAYLLYVKRFVPAAATDHPAAVAG